MRKDISVCVGGWVCVPLSLVIGRHLEIIQSSWRGWDEPKRIESFVLCYRNLEELCYRNLEECWLLVGLITQFTVIHWTALV